jgi:hypothetical protein
MLALRALGRRQPRRFRKRAREGNSRFVCDECLMWRGDDDGEASESHELASLMKLDH